jgi:Universal stress protein family
VAAKWPDVDASFHRAEGRSVPTALTQACDDHSGDLLVLGSSADGRVGEVIVGSTAGPLLHSSAVPVAIAPRGYRAPRGAMLTRLTCAYSGVAGADDLLTATAQMSARMGCALRIDTFGVRGRTIYPPDVGVRAEDLVLQQWKEQVREQQAAARTHLATLGLVDSRTTSQIAVGSHWDEAMDDVDWEPTEGPGGRSRPRSPAGLSAVCYAELAGAVPGVGVVVFLRLRHDRRIARHGRRGLPAAGIRGVRRRGRRRLVAVPE